MIGELREHSRAVVTVVVLALSALAWACGDARPSPAETSGNAPIPNGGGGAARDAIADDGAHDAALSDADSDSDASRPPAICSQVALEGDGIGETSVAGDPPTPMGGALVAGVYHLTARSFYPSFADVGAMPNADRVRRTLVVTTSTIEIAEDTVDTDAGAAPSMDGSVDGGASDPRATASSKFVINGPILERTTTCPVAGAVKNVAFSVTGDDLVFFTSPERTETFTKEP